MTMLAVFALFFALAIGFRIYWALSTHLNWASRVRRLLEQDGFTIREMERRWLTRGPFADMRPPGIKHHREWLIRLVAVDREHRTRAGWVRWRRAWPWEKADSWAVRWDEAPWMGEQGQPATRKGLSSRAFLVPVMVLSTAGAVAGAVVFVRTIKPQLRMPWNSAPQNGGDAGGALPPGGSSTTAHPTLDEAAYNRVLRQHHLDLTRDELITLGEQEFERIEAAMKSLAERIDPARTWRQIVDDYERTHRPRTLKGVIPAYEAEIERARAFVVAKDLVTIPAGPRLVIEETPPHLQANYPYAVYLWRDVLMVTLAFDRTAASEEEALRTHNDGLITVAAIHEVYPGHRVQNLARPGSQIAESFLEGWGFYAEQLMLDLGYYDNRPPEAKLFALRMLLHRVARACLDPKVHRGDLTPDAAVQFLTDRVGVSPDRARLEVEGRYLAKPGSAATYLIGKRQIDQLRRQIEAQEGERFQLKAFHDRLLSQGGLPVQDVARLAFGTELGVEGGLRPGSEGRPAASGDLLSRTRATYASLKSYADTGSVVYEWGTSGVSRHTFRTNYRAPRHFLFEFNEDKTDGGNRLAIWCEGTDFESWDSDTGVRARYPPGKGIVPFMTSTYPTTGVSTQIPSLLFAGTGLVSTLAELGEMAPDGTETIDGRVTHKLTGIARSSYGTGYEHNVRRTTVWIDAETMLVRRIFEDTPAGTLQGTRARRTTTFDPQPNPVLDDGRFRFAVPSPQK